MNIQDIILSNKEIVKIEKEPFGFVNKSNLQFALSEFNYNKRLNIYQKFAVLTRGIAQGHPFIEGNKRTALIVLKGLLRINELRFKTTKMGQEDFILRVAKGKYNNITKLANYIKNNSKKN